MAPEFFFASCLSMLPTRKTDPCSQAVLLAPARRQSLRQPWLLEWGPRSSGWPVYEGSWGAGGGLKTGKSSNLSSHRLGIEINQLVGRVQTSNPKLASADKKQASAQQVQEPCSEQHACAGIVQSSFLVQTQAWLASKWLTNSGCFIRGLLSETSPPGRFIGGQHHN